MEDTTLGQGMDPTGGWDSEEGLYWTTPSLGVLQPAEGTCISWRSLWRSVSLGGMLCCHNGGL